MKKIARLTKRTRPVPKTSKRITELKQAARKSATSRGHIMDPNWDLIAFDAYYQTSCIHCRMLLYVNKHGASGAASVYDCNSDAKPGRGQS